MDENQIAKLLDDATAKSLGDASFRKELVADANAAIKKEYGEELPIKVTMHESNPKKIIFTFPPEAKNGAELDDSNLESVSGGVRSVSYRPIAAYAAFPKY